MSWLAYKPNDIRYLNMIYVLQEYLLSYLQEDFVEKNLCSGVNIEIKEQTNTQILLTFDNVPALQSESTVGYYSSRQQADTDKLYLIKNRWELYYLRQMLQKCIK
uniref:Uncharacterized protein n=1 Tax=Meloidogyne incognita TaxID=6306 RepID=A0A914LBJ8_MELIC